MNNDTQFKTYQEMMTSATPKGIDDFGALQVAWCLLVEELIDSNVIQTKDLIAKFESVKWKEMGGNEKFDFYIHYLNNQERMRHDNSSYKEELKIKRKKT